MFEQFSLNYNYALYSVKIILDYLLSFALNDILGGTNSICHILWYLMPRIVSYPLIKEVLEPKNNNG